MKTRTVSVNSIYLDIVNPRFDAVSNQDEAVEGLLEKCGTKIIKLADDIIEHGINPTDVMICVEEVLPSGKTIFIAKEGNRRLLAIKALLNPRIVSNAKWRSRFLRLTHIANGMGLTPKRLNIAVFSADEAEAMKHWIVIKHDGENGGSGTVPWGSAEKTRFSGNGRNSYATMVKTWLKGFDGLSSEDVEKMNNAPITTFDRILSSAQGRVILGVSFQDGKLHAQRRVENVVSNLLCVVHDLTSTDPTNPRKKLINVSDVKNTELIQRYLSKFERDDDWLDKPVLLAQDIVNSIGTQAAIQTQSGTPTPSRRGGFAPVASSKAYLQRRLREVGTVAQMGKVKQLVLEMLQMPIEKVPLSFCIVFRSLLDISLHGFAHRNGISTENVKLKTLAVQCQTKILAMPQWNYGNPKQWIKEAIHILNSETIFSIPELHNLVHGTMQVPSCDNILTYAPRIVPFLVALNGGEPPQEA